METDVIGPAFPMTDAMKLEALADWFDVRDDKAGYTGERSVRNDLRRIASGLSQ